MQTSHAATNLLYVQQLCANNNVVVEFHPNSFYIKDQCSWKVFLHGVNKVGLYRLYRILVQRTMSVRSYDISNSSIDLFVDPLRWHAHMGHSSFDTIKMVLQSDLVKLLVVKNKNNVSYKFCQRGKSYKLPFT